MSIARFPSHTTHFYGKRRRHLVALTALAAIVATSWGSAIADGLSPRANVIKPAQTRVSPTIHRTDEIFVKFVDGKQIRMRRGTLSDLSNNATDSLQEVFDSLPNAQWRRAHKISEQKLSELRSNAEARLGRRIADMNLEFRVSLPDGIDAAEAIDALNKLDVVEIALPVPLPMAAPLPPNYQGNQGYLNAATAGVDAVCMWQLPGGTGNNSSVADIEYSWNFNHNDLPTMTLLGPTPVDPFSDNNHGTAVMGELASLNNGWGTTGITYNSTTYVVAANTSAGYDVGAAITTALGTLTAGDVILIEQQIAGPNYTGSPPGTQFGLVPVEWYQPYYNAIVTAVGNGVVVVEAAGNGSQNLDSATYTTGNGGHWPFLPANDSGAIIVGAGASPGGSDTDRSRLGYSNYGATLDLQGWGENIYTTGYGDLYSAEGTNRWYTGGFGGTSGASPIVTGACATLQSAHFAATFSYLTPAQVRTHLRNTGSPQQAGTYPISQNIGPRPDTAAALCAAVPALDANSNLVPDLCEQLANIGACCFTSGACTDTTSANCIAFGGTPQGIGTACATTVCAGPPTEACCFANGTCTDMTASTCTTSGGTPQGAGTACATTTCPILEACCFQNGTCSDLTPTACVAGGGTPQGAGTTCATTVCRLTYPKFSQPPTQDREDIPSNIDLVLLQPNIANADDFQSDGRPIVAVRWWGSYLDQRFLPTEFGGEGEPFSIDGWFISFHEPLNDDQSLPPLPPLGLYFAPVSAVTITLTGIPSCDNHQVFEYYVDISNCCLICSLPDSRSGRMPAQPAAFEEEWCFDYDIDIEAVIGQTFEEEGEPGPDPGGNCIAIPTGNTSTGVDFWGWHSTDNENGKRAALQSKMSPGDPTCPYWFGPWFYTPPICAPSPVNMSFELLTDDPNIPPPCTEACCFDDATCLDLLPQACINSGGIPQGPATNCATTICTPRLPKFEQPPTENREDIPSIIDLVTMVPDVVVADDFRSDGRPITFVRWWGSYIDERFRPIEYEGFGSPYAIDGWLISFHEPLIEDPTAPPQEVLGLYFARVEDVIIRQTSIPTCDNHEVFEYTVEIDDCCLLWSRPDNRSGHIPAEPQAFTEEWCFWYDIDIQAVVGMTWVDIDPAMGLCSERQTQNAAEDMEVWGWHATDIENGQRSALTSTTTPGLGGTPWLYGPWFNTPPICGPEPVNMSFILFTDDPNVPLPCCDCPGDLDGNGIVNGLDIQPFVNCLLGNPVSFNVNCACVDMTGDGVMDSNDIPLFVATLLNTPVCP